MRRSKAQLNAISRSYTVKHQKESLIKLEEMGIDFDSYCKIFNYHGSPVRLVTSLEYNEVKAVKNVYLLKTFIEEVRKMRSYETLV